MSAQAFKIYNLAKKKIGNTSINLAATVYRMTLHQSASNAATLTLGTFASLTSEVWTVGASAKQYKFEFDDVVWTGTGGTIPNIKVAVVWLSGASANGRHLLAVASLTSSQFTLSQNNTLTLQINSAGCFTMA